MRYDRNKPGTNISITENRFFPHTPYLGLQCRHLPRLPLHRQLRVLAPGAEGGRGGLHLSRHVRRRAHRQLEGLEYTTIYIYMRRN